MYEPDYEESMEYFQNQLAEKGITKDMQDMDNFCGLTASELQNIVDGASLVKKEAV